MRLRRASTGAGLPLGAGNASAEPPLLWRSLLFDPPCAVPSLAAGATLWAWSLQGAGHGPAPCCRSPGITGVPWDDVLRGVQHDGTMQAACVMQATCLRWCEPAVLLTFGPPAARGSCHRYGGYPTWFVWHEQPGGVLATRHPPRQTQSWPHLRGLCDPEPCPRRIQTCPSSEPPVPAAKRLTMCQDSGLPRTCVSTCDDDEGIDPPACMRMCVCAASVRCDWHSCLNLTCDRHHPLHACACGEAFSARDRDLRDSRCMHSCRHRGWRFVD